jgi:hypothetical protein
MKLTKCVLRGRYKNKNTGKTVNIHVGRVVGRSVDVNYYLYQNKRIFISDNEFDQWERVI